MLMIVTIFNKKYNFVYGIQFKLYLIELQYA